MNKTAQPLASLATAVPSRAASREISFVEYNGWGHAFHSDTWREVPRKTPLWRRLLRKDDLIRHYSVMVHSAQYPREGDTVRFKSKAPGGSTVARIIGVKPCFDPADMFTLKLEISPSMRAAAARSQACEAGGHSMTIPVSGEG